MLVTTFDFVKAAVLVLYFWEVFSGLYHVLREKSAAKNFYRKRPLDVAKLLASTSFGSSGANDNTAVKISIHVFGWRREKSLRRLGESLLKAHYMDHTIDIHFHIDGEALDLVQQYVHEFSWPHGQKHVNFREQRVGMPLVCTRWSLISGSYDWVGSE